MPNAALLPSEPAMTGPRLDDPTPHDATMMMRYDANKRSALVAYLLWFFFGLFGAHRFYLDRTGTAVAMLLISIASFILTFVLVGLLGFLITGIWALVDAFLIPAMARDYNNGLINRLNRAGQALI